MSSFSKLISIRSITEKSDYTTSFFRAKNSSEREKLSKLLNSDSGILVADELRDQLKELIKIEHPTRKLTSDEIESLISEKLGDTPAEEYGVWVYYPWLRKVVHLLDEEEFIKVRTSRNQYKITAEERDLLGSKKVGVIGLSVGQSASVTMAMERTFGEIRIADFDNLELTNLNRIRTGTQNLGIPKVTMVAREIAEIDPYLKVVPFFEGITEDNIEQFFTEDGMLDLLVEECDGVDIKILAREVAKKHRVPIVMDMSDRGCLDIERYDLEEDYPLLHGFIPENVDYELMKSLETNEEKMPYLLPMVQTENLSPRMKASLLEVGQTIGTWPQLSSDVVMGGAFATNLVRRILLDQLHVSGRYYIDPDELIRDEDKNNKKELENSERKDLSQNQMFELIEKAGSLKIPNSNISSDVAESIIEKAIGAPSVGNMQPWLWCEDNGLYFLFRDKKITEAFSDAKGIGTLISHGTTLETMRIEAEHRGIKTNIEWFPLGSENEMTAAVSFSNHGSSADENIEYYHGLLDLRCTQRETPERSIIDHEKLQSLIQEVAESKNTRLHIVTEPEQVDAIGRLVRKGDRIRLMNPHGHRDFFGKEVRWNREHSGRTRDGLDMSLFEMSPSDQIGMQVLKNWEGVDFLRKIKGGNILERVSKKSFESASAIGVLSVPDHTPEYLVEAGQMLQRMWLRATDKKIAMQPMTVLQMLFPFTEDPKGLVEAHEVNELRAIKRDFYEIVDIPEGRKDVFLFRMFQAENTKPKSFRKPLHEVLTHKADVQI
ncbi:Rv1355c family protein [Halocola ammonii]